MRQSVEETTQTKSKSSIPLYTLFVANIISSVGNVLTFLAVPWFVLQTTGSVAETGITAFFTTIPIVISAFFSSTLVDRLGYKRASIVSDIASAIAVALIPLLYHTVGLPFWQLQVLVFLGGLLKVPGDTARTSLVPDLAEMAKMRLERATAAIDGIIRISRFIGAPLAGILIALIGSSNLLWIDAATFAVSALLVGLAVTSSPAIIRAGKSGHYFANLREGVRFIRHDRLIWAITLTVMVTNLLDAGYGSVLQPVYVKQVFGTPLALGLLVAAFGGTAFVGTIIFGAIGHRLPRRLTLGIGFTIAGGIRFWALALIPIFPLLLVIYAITGFGVGPVNPLLDTVQYERVPTEMRARVFGTVTAGVFVGMPLGAIISGYFVTWIGIQSSLLILGACYLVATISLLVNPALQEMEKLKTD